MYCGFDVPTLEKFVHYIASVIEKKNSMVCQRQLMTNNLREQIKGGMDISVFVVELL